PPPRRPPRREAAGNPPPRRRVPPWDGRPRTAEPGPRPCGGGRTMNRVTRPDGAHAPDPGAARHTVAVGGGLAGTTTALALADARAGVTLLAGGARLVARAVSVRRGEPPVDNGQHVYLRCCTAYRWLLDRVGGAGLAPLEARLDVAVVDLDRPEGR